MFYVATSRGFLASAEWKTFHQDIRSAQSFPTFAAANNAAKALRLKGKLQHWCVLTPSPWEVQDKVGATLASFIGFPVHSQEIHRLSHEDLYGEPEAAPSDQSLFQKQSEILPDRG